MADYADGEGELPPELSFYLLTKAWGDPNGLGWGKWPAKWFTRVRVARNVYNAWKGYTAASNRAKYEDTSGIVGMVKNLRFSDERRVTGDELRERVLVWEKWEGIESEGIEDG